MKTMILIVLAGLAFCTLAPSASADIVRVSDPHPDSNATGNTCIDAFAVNDAVHVGVCAGTYVPCPLYVVVNGIGAC